MKGPNADVSRSDRAVDDIRTELCIRSVTSWPIDIFLVFDGKVDQSSVLRWIMEDLVEQ